MKTTTDTAIGSYEAACVLGVHFTQPSQMAREGQITTRLIRSMSGKANVEREVAVYSLESCQANFADYEQRQKDGSVRRPRSYAAERPAMLRKLAKMKVHVDFHDAIGSVEAGEILGCTLPWCVKLARQGKIAGRLLLSNRASEQASRRWIYSRKSCEAAAADVRRQMAAGAKIGRPRSRIKRSVDK